MRIIGDRHGKIAKYHELTSSCSYSLQVGDMGFDYRDLYSLDSTRHKFVPGNHDNYDLIPNAYSLGDYGVWKADVDIFFVRGAWSIDGCTGLWPNNRRQGVDWWAEEELEMGQLEKAIELYCQLKPDLVVTHEAPYSIVQMLKNKGFLLSKFDVTKTRTSLALQVMMENHLPERWFYGHYHNNDMTQVGRCAFRCVDELNFVDLE